MTIVLDTNVLVSGLLNPRGAPGRVLDLIIGGHVQLVVDDRVLDEYVEVTSRPEFGFETKDINALISFIDTSAIHVQAKLLVERLPDPDDEPFLEVAIAGGVDALVTGNLRHFPAKSAHGIRVISPANFLAPHFRPTER